MSGTQSIIVITSALLSFKVEGCRWTTHRNADGDKTVASVWASEVEETPAKLVAEFTDIHAIYFGNEAELLTQPT